MADPVHGETLGDSETLSEASNVLVLASLINDAGASACSDLLADAVECVDRLVVVTVGHTPGQWQQYVDDRPEMAATPITYVDVKTLVRSTAATDESASITPAATVSSPADLGSLGTALNELMSEAAAEGERVGLCLHSITDMLQFVDREFLFEFLHAVGARVRHAGGVGFYHLDNDSPDDKLETLFSHLCDAVVEVQNDEVSISPGYYAVDGPESPSTDRL